MAQGPNDTDAGFFNRWSQRKQQALRVDEPLEEDAATAKPDAPEPEPGTVPAAPELSEEELAALPSIDALTPDTDIKVFMRAGVPKALRNAALRKMWMITPAIRDHLDPAVDYAWDWNTPGGVPGDGIAPSPEKAAQMLRDLFKPRENKMPEVPEDEIHTAPEDEGAEQIVAGQATEKNIPDPVRMPGAASLTPPKDEKPAPRHTAELQPAPRRHGGALPE